MRHVLRLERHAGVLQSRPGFPFGRVGRVPPLEGTQGLLEALDLRELLGLPRGTSSRGLASFSAGSFFAGALRLAGFLAARFFWMGSSSLSEESSSSEDSLYFGFGLARFFGGGFTGSSSLSEEDGDGGGFFLGLGLAAGLAGAWSWERGTSSSLEESDMVVGGTT